MSDLVRAFLQEQVDRNRVPGLQFAWASLDRRIFSASAGWADLQNQRRLTDTTCMMAYSMSKVLTAEVVARLARVGLFHLDEAVGRFLPELPFGANLTLRQLLEHRAGLPNPIPLRWVHPLAAQDTFDENQALARVLERYSRLRPKPSAKKRYSNLGYWLLGKIVERATGETFAASVEKHLLQPLGITSHEISYRFPQTDYAHGYLERFSAVNLLLPWLTDDMGGESIGRWRRIRDHLVNGPAFGGAFGTARGFCKLAAHLLVAQDPGFGWESKSGQSWVQKEGGGAGFHTLLRVDRQRQRASVLMTNATLFNVKACLDQLDTILDRSAGTCQPGGA